MKFLCLGYLNEKEFDSLSEAEKSEAMKDCGKHCETMNATGQIIAEASLRISTEARTVRIRNGKQTVTAGAFMDCKEQLGGFFIVEAADLDEAVSVASLHPAALLGEEFGWGIEVRPIMEENLF